MTTTKSLLVVIVDVKESTGWHIGSYRHLLVITPHLGTMNPHSPDLDAHTIQISPLNPMPHTENGKVSSLMRAMLQLDFGLYE